MIDKTIFRKYDIRGKYPGSLNEDAAYSIGLAYANIFPGIKRVVIGGDIKSSTPALKESLARGLNDGGVDVADIGIRITPLLNFVICSHGFDGGIQVTGSHLAGAYNGIKMQLKDAYPVPSERYDEMLRLILEDRLRKKDMKGNISTLDCEEEYIGYMAKKFRIHKSMKILIDSGNGTAGTLPEKILKRLGCDAKTIYPEPDGSFPNHVPDPYKKENLKELKERVVSEGYDLGIAFDGDGDRTGIIDREGNIISGDLLLMVFARDALKKRRGTIVCDARASLALIEDVAGHGGKTLLTVGHHKAVLDKIIELDAPFGGETTGHVYFPMEHYKIDDAVFAALKVVELASKMDDFSAYIKSLPRYPRTDEIFISFPDTEKFRAVGEFVSKAKAKGWDVNDVDGARVSFRDSWGIVRAANTSPYIKVKFEGRTKTALKEAVSQIRPLMKECGISIPDDELKEIMQMA